MKVNIINIIGSVGIDIYNKDPYPTPFNIYICITPHLPASTKNQKTG